MFSSDKQQVFFCLYLHYNTTQSLIYLNLRKEILFTNCETVCKPKHLVTK